MADGTWHLPAQAWSKAETGDDAIVITCYKGEWHARTEFDQCVKRDLDHDDIASIRREFAAQLI